VPAAEEVDLHLHAWKCRFRQPFTGEMVEITDPAPGWAEQYGIIREL